MVSLSLFFILLIQYLFVFSLSNPEPITLPRLPGRHRKRDVQGRRDTKELWEVKWRQLRHMAKRMRKATIRQKSPMASERAKPRMA